MKRQGKVMVVIGYLLMLVGLALPLYCLSGMLWGQASGAHAYKAFTAMATAPAAKERQGIERYEARLEQENAPVDPFLIDDYRGTYDFYRSHPDQVFAYLAIDSLRIYQPVYLDATMAHLAMGVAQIDGTSLPIGGRGRRCVIAGHRGWYNDLMFLHLEQLAPGDEVKISRGGRELRYQVIGHEVIDPGDWDRLAPVPGKDLLTLLTCDPKWPPSPQRLLVHCERLEEVAAPASTAVPAAVPARPAWGLSWGLGLAWLVLVLLEAGCVLSLLAYLRRKRER